MLRFKDTGKTFQFGVCVAALVFVVDANLSSAQPAHSPLDAKLEAYARAAHLSPLLASKRAELRIWIYDYLTSTVTGHLVNSKGIGYYKMYGGPDGRSKFSGPRAMHWTMSGDTAPILNLMYEMRRFNRQSWTCRQ